MSKMFCTQKTAEQMAEESRKATIDGMRQVAEALRKKRKRRLSLESSSSEETLSSIESSDAGAAKLEERIHYLQLDLSNAEVEKQDLKEEIEALKTRLTPYKRINDEVQNLNSSLDRATRNCDNLTLEQLQKKLATYNEEFTEHYQLCQAQINKLDLCYTQYTIQQYMTSMWAKHLNARAALEKRVDKKHLVKFVENLLFILGIIKLIFLIIGLITYYAW